MALVAAVAAGAAAAAVPVTQAAAAATPQLVAAYGFDDGAGTTAVDSSGNGLNGLVAGATWTNTGAFGGALSFDGTSSRVVVPGDSRLDLAEGFTLAAWIRPDSVDGWRSVLVRERGEGLAYGLYASSDQYGPDVAVNTGDTDTNLPGPSPLSVGAWSHLAATYDPAVGLVVYVNGTVVAETPLSGPLNLDGVGDLSIGGNAVWGEYFHGLIDEVRIWNGPLAAGDVKANVEVSVAAAPGTRPQISQPPRGTRVGGTVYLQASKGYQTPTSVQFLLDGAPLGAPVTWRLGQGYVLDWQASTATPGWHTLAARALHADGTSLDSGPYSVEVAAPRPGLLGAWGFNEPTARAYDYSGNGNHLALNDAMQTPGEFRTGLTKHGEVGSAKVADTAVLSPGGALTVSAWVRPNANLDGTQPLVVKSVWAGPIEYGLFATRDSAGLTGVITTDAGTFTVTAGDLTIGHEAHVSLTYDGAALRLFVEYNEVASVPAGGTIIDGTGGLSMLSAPGDGKTDLYLGVIDSVRIYNRALTAEELGNDNTPA